MPLSRELQLAKAAEHLVCCDLIMKGYNAFLADQGLPYDLVVEVNGTLKRVQVKCTSVLTDYERSQKLYRFAIRKVGKYGKKCVNSNDIDYYAFVVFPTKQIAYLPIELVSKNGKVKSTMEFKTRSIDYPKRIYKNGTIRQIYYGKYLEDYEEFNNGG